MQLQYRIYRHFNKHQTFEPRTLSGPYFDGLTQHIKTSLATIVFTILIHIYYFEQRYKFILLRSEDMQVDIYTQFGVGITSLSSEHVIYCKPSGITSLSLEHVIYCKPSLNQCSRLSNEDWKNVTDQSITHAATRSSIVATLFGQAKLIESRYLSLFYSAHIPLTCVILAYVHHH